MGLLRILGIEKYLKKVKSYVDEQSSPMVSGGVTGSAILKNSKAKADGKFATAIGADNIFGQATPSQGDKLEYATASGYAAHAEGSAHAIGDYSMLRVVVIPTCHLKDIKLSLQQKESVAMPKVHIHMR